MKIRKKPKKILLFIYHNIEGIMLALLAFMLVVDVLLGIIARYVHFDTVFATELGKYLFIWLCFVGISAAVKDRQHVRLTLFVEKLPVNRKITWIISQILFLLFSLFFVYWGTELVIFHISMEKSAMGFDFPVYYFTAALPVGFALTALRLTTNIIQTLKGNYNTPPWELSTASGLGGISTKEK